MRVRPVGAISGRENIVFNRSKLRTGQELAPRYDAKFPPPCAEAVALKTLRGELQLEEREAARAMGIRRSILQDLEAGRSIPEVPGAWEQAMAVLREAAKKRDESARNRW